MSYGSNGKKEEDFGYVFRDRNVTYPSNTLPIILSDRTLMKNPYWELRKPVAGDEFNFKFASNDKKMEYEITSDSRSGVHVWCFQKEGKDNDYNTKVHINRDKDGTLRWLGIGPVSDKQNGNKKDYSALDFFIKKFDNGPTITKMDEEIARAMGYENNFTWSIPNIDQKIEVIRQSRSVKMPTSLTGMVNSTAWQALNTGAKLFEDGNEKYKYYPNRKNVYQELLENILCAKPCKCTDCLPERFAKLGKNERTSYSLE